MKKRVPWNKGLTKETDERLAKIGKKLSKLQKGRTPWNKGLTKETDGRIKQQSQKLKQWWIDHPEFRRFSELRKKRISEALKRYKRTPEHNRKISESNKGHISWNKGLTLEDPRVKRNIEKGREKRLRTLRTKECRSRISKSISKELKKRWQTPEYRNKMTEERKRRWQNPEYKQRVRHKIVEATTSEEYRLKQGLASKLRWADPEYKQKLLKAILRGSFKRPTEPERKTAELLNRVLPNEYKYVGNGEFIIGGLCPDFINVNGKKKIIEVFGRVFHDPKVSFKDKIPFYRTEWGRKKIFKRYGFDTLVIWDDELKDKETVTTKILTLQGVDHHNS